MIRSVQNSTATAAAASSSSVKPASSAGKKFADVHKAAMANISAPEGETWAPMSGDPHYARIASGPRVGKYVNLGQGERRGQIFTIEQHGGKTMHVYESGTSVEATADEVKVKGKSAKLDARVAADQPPKGETWVPVDGHNNYADILSGKRNGLFVNISGGVRDGMAFQIVKHGEKTFHIYGSGKDRQVIEVGAHKQGASSKTTSTPSTPGTPTTGPASSTGGSTPSGDTSVSTSQQ